MAAKKFVVPCLVALTALAPLGCYRGQPDPETLIPAEGEYDVTIKRDDFGVPHIFGKTDADVAYGLAYANCEDDYDTMEQGLFLSRGEIGMREGREMAPFDYLVKLFKFREVVEEQYETDLPEDTRALLEAYADGMNHYAALHPEEVHPDAPYPATGQDIVAGFVIKSPMFFGMDRYARKLLDENYHPEIAEKETVAEVRTTADGLKFAKDVSFAGPGFLTGDTEIGSNTFAVAPSRTADGSTFLNINSHQPFTGPVAWYEAHLKSEEGLDIVGGVFPGTPIILHGHNQHLGWAHTVNKPDLVDLYALELNPENENQYMYDGEWLDFERDEVTLKVKLWGGIKIPVTRETLHSVHGPAMRTPSGAVYAIKYAGYGDITQVEQWYRMNKATNIDAFEEALRIQGIASFNIGYADKDGNIWYVYNAKFPKRAPGWDWSKVLPGNISETNWTEYEPFEAMPQIRNPEAGYVYNCNGSPFLSTAVSENLDPDDFSPTLGFEDHDTNRELRAFELLDADDSISWEEFYAIKYDTKYSEQSRAAHYKTSIPENVKSDDPVVREAIEVLKRWNLDTDLENTSTAVAVMSMEPVVRAEIFGQKVPDINKVFVEKAKLLHETFGKVDVPWGEVNHLVRGDLSLPIEGGPDTLRAVYGSWDAEAQQLAAEAGDCYVLLVRWDKDGNMHSESIHQFGSATLDPESPHYADQAKLFVKTEMKPTRMNEADLAGHITREYRPGEEV